MLRACELPDEARQALSADQPSSRDHRVVNGRGGGSRARTSRSVASDHLPITSSATALAWVTSAAAAHLPNTKRIRAFKLMRIAGAYGGDEQNRELQRSTAPPGSPRRRSRSTCTGSRRPSGVTTASSGGSSTCTISRCRDRLRPARLPPQGGLLRRMMEDYSRAGTRRPATSSSRPPHRQGHFVRDVRAPRLVLRRDVPADAPRRDARPPEEGPRQDYYLKPMNCPFHWLDLQGAWPVLP